MLNRKHPSSNRPKKSVDNLHNLSFGVYYKWNVKDFLGLLIFFHSQFYYDNPPCVNRHIRISSLMKLNIWNIEETSIIKKYDDLSRWTYLLGEKHLSLETLFIYTEKFWIIQMKIKSTFLKKFQILYMNWKSMNIRNE